MFTHLSTILTLSKGIAAITLTAAVATSVTPNEATARAHTPSPTPVAPSSAPKGADYEVLVRDCLEKYAAFQRNENDETRRAAKEACPKAIEASGLTPDEFWAKFSPKAEPKPTEKPNSSDFEALLRGCAEKYEALLTGEPTDAMKQAAREACAKAQEASGLTPDEFSAKIQALLHRPKPTDKPRSDAERLVRECVERFEGYLRSETDETRRAAREACAKAQKASGLTPDEFWAKFLALVHRTKPAAEPTGDLERLVRDCLEKYAINRREPSDEHLRVAKEACAKAVEASGLTPDEFWKKFSPKAEPKPTTKPTTTELAALVKYCLTKYAYAASLKDAPAELVEKARRAASETCAKAIAASGLTPEQFWAKYGPKPAN